MPEVFYAGPNPDTADQLAEGLGLAVRSEYPAAAAPGDLVFLSTRADADTADAFPGRNAFAACRALKGDPRVRVFLLVEEGDQYSPEVARFCLADACVSVGDDGALGDLSVVRASVAAIADRVPLDDLLKLLEDELSSDEKGQASAIQRILCDDRQTSIIDDLTDQVTGLFAGPFASFKLDEEFKRAVRFHHPLSLILLDIGDPDSVLHADPEQRETCLAEVASVFLNECRDIDVLARFTETTFLFLLPGTGGAGASMLAGRMIEELESRSFGGSRLTPHAGVATVPASGIAHRSAFLARAEACLRLAREGRGAGGVCVSCE